MSPEQLRIFADHQNSELATGAATASALRQAADEIERLQAARAEKRGKLREDAATALRKSAEAIERLQTEIREERGKGPTREEVARIIDLPAWETRDRIYSFPDAVTEWVDRHVAPSLAKADAILALFQKDKSL
jgi:hypothetical protein